MLPGSIHRIGTGFSFLVEIDSSSFSGLFPVEEEGLPSSSLSSSSGVLGAAVSKEEEAEAGRGREMKASSCSFFLVVAAVVGREAEAGRGREITFFSIPSMMK